MNNRIRTFALLCFLSLVSEEANAELVGAFRLGDMAKDADVICAADVTAVRQSRADDFPFEALCEVESDLKGKPGKQVAVGFRREGTFQIGERAILFLRAAKDGINYTLTDERLAKLALPRYSKQVDRPELPLKERIARQYLVLFDSDKPEDIAIALRHLGQIEYPVEPAILQSLCHHPDGEVATISMCQLITKGEPKAIRDALDMILGAHKADLPAPTDRQRERLAVTLIEAGDRVPVDECNRMAQSVDLVIANAAVNMLRRIGNESSVPILMESLQRPNRQLRRMAIVALSKITKGEGPEWGGFDADLAEEAEKWENWWKTAKDRYKNQ